MVNHTSASTLAGEGERNVFGSPARLERLEVVLGKVLQLRQPIGRCAFCLAVCLSVFLSGQVTFAQDDLSLSADQQIQRHLDSGEFPLAIQRSGELPEQQRDRWLSQIARHQLQAGVIKGAFHTAQQIQLDDARSGTLGDLYGQQFGRPAGGAGAGGPAGQAGGVTLQDFTPLIQLIQNTIQPDSWQDTGQGLGTIQPYPAGVFVSADGTLKRIKTDQTQTARRLRRRAANDSGNRDVTMTSKLRMVSLTRLEREAEWRSAQGLPPDPMMQNLAGLYGIDFLTVFPGTGDIVIAGPAGNWEMGDHGRPVNVDTGLPVLQLDDLVVCLRNAKTSEGKFGCSINPREKNLVATKNYLQNTEMKGKRWADGLRQALGQQDIEVFGIDPRTHAARVLVEADYRMKLIGMGLEPSIPEVPSYFDRLAEREEASSSDIVRWWFTMNYDDIVADQDRTVFTFAGTGVKVQSENEFLNQQGKRVHTGQSNPETAGFAKDFTDHFEQLSERYPVYRQLKNVFDLALVAGLIEKQQLDRQVEWNQRYFVGSQGGRGLTYQVRYDVSPSQVDSVMNEKVIRKRKQRSTVTQRIVGVSGGISFDAAQVISAPLATDDSGDLSKQRDRAEPNPDANVWWWD